MDQSDISDTRTTFQVEIENAKHDLQRTLPFDEAKRHIMAIASRQIRNLETKNLRIEGYFDDKKAGMVRKWDINDEDKYLQTLSFTAKTSANNVFYIIAHFTESLHPGSQILEQNNQRQEVQMEEEIKQQPQRQQLAQSEMQTKPPNLFKDDIWTQPQAEQQKQQIMAKVKHLPPLNKEMRAAEGVQQRYERSSVPGKITAGSINWGVDNQVDGGPPSEVQGHQGVRQDTNEMKNGQKASREYKSRTDSLNSNDMQNHGNGGDGGWNMKSVFGQDDRILSTSEKINLLKSLSNEEQNHSPIEVPIQQRQQSNPSNFGNKTALDMWGSFPIQQASEEELVDQNFVDQNQQADDELMAFVMPSGKNEVMNSPQKEDSHYQQLQQPSPSLKTNETDQLNHMINQLKKQIASDQMQFENTTRQLQEENNTLRGQLQQTNIQAKESVKQSELKTREVEEQLARSDERNARLQDELTQTTNWWREERQRSDRNKAQFKQDLADSKQSTFVALDQIQELVNEQRNRLQGDVMQIPEVVQIREDNENQHKFIKRVQGNNIDLRVPNQFPLPIVEGIIKDGESDSVSDVGDVDLEDNRLSQEQENRQLQAEVHLQQQKQEIVIKNNQGFALPSFEVNDDSNYQSKVQKLLDAKEKEYMIKLQQMGFDDYMTNLRSVKEALQQNQSLDDVINMLVQL